MLLIEDFAVYRSGLAKSNLSNKFIKRLKGDTHGVTAFKERIHLLARQAGFGDVDYLDVLDLAEWPSKPPCGDPLVIAVGKILGLEPAECFDPSTDADARSFDSCFRALSERERRIFEHYGLIRDAEKAAESANSQAA